MYICHNRVDIKVHSEHIIGKPIQSQERTAKLFFLFISQLCYVNTHTPPFYDIWTFVFVFSKVSKSKHVWVSVYFPLCICGSGNAVVYHSVIFCFLFQSGVLLPVLRCFHCLDSCIIFFRFWFWILLSFLGFCLALLYFLWIKALMQV